jgi:hypothetical protein
MFSKKMSKGEWLKVYGIGLGVEGILTFAQPINSSTDQLSLAGRIIIRNDWSLVK